ncbi:hypothetical protein DFH29DRAFT_1073690 [Suillus ampliporus]|nr:hypothetical protein DFH29DRAFT_1073690 [Suillus ampliporus]
MITRICALERQERRCGAMAWNFAGLKSLAKSLADIFAQRGVLSDLDEAIRLYCCSVPLAILIDQRLSSTLPSALEPDSHSGACCLFSMGQLNTIRLHLGFALLAILIIPCLSTTLPTAFKPYRAYPDLSRSLNNLATNLQTRFEQLGVPSDLDEAIELDRAALFKQRGVLSDLDEAIELDRAALKLCPPAHFHHSVSLNDLAHSLYERFEQRGVLSGLDEAVKLHQAALEYCPPGHFHHSTSLNNLANSLQARFEQHSILSDLDEATESRVH